MRLHLLLKPKPTNQIFAQFSCVCCASLPVSKYDWGIEAQCMVALLILYPTHCRAVPG